MYLRPKYGPFDPKCLHDCIRGCLLQLYITAYPWYSLQNAYRTPMTSFVRSNKSPWNRDHPLVAPFPNVKIPANHRSTVPKPTVKTYGYSFDIIPRVGPSFAAKSETIIPFFIAKNFKITLCSSKLSRPPLEIREMKIKSTPSTIAWFMPKKVSE